MPTLRDALAKLNLNSEMPRRSPNDDMISATNTVVPYEQALGRIQRAGRKEPVAQATNEDDHANAAPVDRAG